MTLKEKFRAFDSMNWRNEENEKIADEFAMNFADWLLNERTGFNRETEIKELLEIYKKEKGL